ncbi:hypothetical protein AX774_g1608 [Zancudomyces culisetae]|uniref:Uncharacterized protein n=1 Tax=Zancudomyces culisetae TaxID=1213189 RepID=A0A1R1PV73_ZANCU|nr:hypothetical protein AX774_g6861 [Zancudomyces culisetae]OMH84875.1 hypothetical protein AX774_g1608 [Zancudomyces culisetae]|eukprot:OMH79711.1 hypothetical protein AX774_g6861 [Zancudomyces culisetae]
MGCEYCRGWKGSCCIKTLPCSCTCHRNCDCVYCVTIMFLNKDTSILKYQTPYHDPIVQRYLSCTRTRKPAHDLSTNKMHRKESSSPKNNNEKLKKTKATDFGGKSTHLLRREPSSSKDIDNLHFENVTNTVIINPIYKNNPSEPFKKSKSFGGFSKVTSYFSGGRKDKSIMKKETSFREPNEFLNKPFLESVYTRTKDVNKILPSTGAYCANSTDSEQSDVSAFFYCPVNDQLRMPSSEEFTIFVPRLTTVAK